MEIYPFKKAVSNANQIQNLAGHNPTKEHYDLANEFVDKFNALEKETALKREDGVIALPTLHLPPDAIKDERQLQIIQLLRQGLLEEHRILTNKEVASKLNETEEHTKALIWDLKLRAKISHTFLVALLDREAKQGDELVLPIVSMLGIKFENYEKRIIVNLQDNLRQKHYFPTQRELASQLGLTRGTYKVYISNLLAKTGLTDFEQLVFINPGRIKGDSSTKSDDADDFEVAS